MKVCFKCGVSKPLDDFYKHPAMGDGRLGKCKECTKRDVQQNYAKNREYYLEYDKSRLHAPHRIKARAEYQKSHPDVMRRLRKKYKERYPDKYAAHITAGNAIRDGKLIRMPCEVCGNERSEAHHEDYSKPLEVVWLCKKHHMEADQKRRAREKTMKKPAQSVTVVAKEITA